MYYEIERSNVRIAGTLHMFPADQPALPSWVSQAYTWSQRLIFEHDAAAAAMLFRMTLPPGSMVADVLPPPLFNRLQAVWPENHPLGSIRNQKLWVIGMRLPLIGVQLANGVEPTLTGRAQRENRSIEYLETGLEFAESADRIDNSRFARLIETTLNSLHLNEQRVRRLHSAWMTRQLSALESFLPESILAADPVIRNAVLDQRTRAWIPKIMEALSSPQATLVAVGALHFVGPNGLVSLLEQAGQTLTPLPT
jgi:uncharacterized protein YbaP (TraB family)